MRLFWQKQRRSLQKLCFRVAKA